MIIKTDNGVSPILAVLLMVAVTLVLSGVVAVWVVQFNDFTSDDGDHYLFDVSLDGTDDHLMISVVSGERLNTSYTKIMIDDTDMNLTETEIYAGDILDLVSPLDMTVGEYYNVKIIIHEKLVYNNDLVAAP